jgi:hypothetical protein
MTYINTLLFFSNVRFLIVLFEQTIYQWSHTMPFFDYPTLNFHYIKKTNIYLRKINVCMVWCSLDARISNYTWSFIKEKCIVKTRNIVDSPNSFFREINKARKLWSPHFFLHSPISHYEPFVSHTLYGLILPNKIFPFLFW